MLDYGDPMFFIIVPPFYRREEADGWTLTLCNGGQATTTSNSNYLCR
jgi:hypothetical protein